MKKSLLALAVLGTFAGVASAQSTVTLFGVVDLNARQTKNGSNDALNTLSTDGNASSRLGFRGVEDLGGGLSAGFWLEAGLRGDVGTLGGANGGFNGNAAGTNLSGTPGAAFNRRSTVSLLGGWGELRLGRDYTPAFWNTTVFDPFGTNGVAAFTNLSINGLGTAANGSYVRVNNSIGYFLPSNLGGLYGQIQTSAGEGSTAINQANKHSAGRIGYAAGPFNIAGSYGVTDTAPDKWKHWNIAGSWNFGFMNLMAQYDMQDAGPREQKTYLIGTVVPLGQGEFKFSYAKADQSGGGFGGADADQIGVGYVYNLSKRTAMYGHFARIKNKNAQANFVVPDGFGSAANDTSRGFEVGLRHSF
jgi:predicted porin